MHSIMLSLVLLTAVSLSRAAESDFYRTLVTSAGTSALAHPATVTSPLLVDTNNSSPKIAGSTNSLAAMSHRGELAGVRLGMSTSEVVARWGKPPHLRTNCGGVRSSIFIYSDCTLHFTGDSLWIIQAPGLSPAGFFGPGRVCYFGDGISSNSRSEDIVRAFGEPAHRTKSYRNWPELHYGSSRCDLVLGFEPRTGEMRELRIQGTGTDGGSGH
jgi:hypothetical protein